MAIYYYSIGARIRFYRTQKSMTLEELAEKADVSKQHISRIERGEKYPNLEIFINIANALEISADELLVDNLMHSSSKHDGDDFYVLLDCSPEEATILVKNMKGLKDILRKYTIK